MPINNDPFSSSALKIRALLGLSEAARVLLVGDHFVKMASDFAFAFRSVSNHTQSDGPDELAESSIFDLVCVDLFSTTGARVQTDLLTLALRHVAPNGFAWVASRQVRALDYLLGTQPPGTRWGATLTREDVADRVHGEGFETIEHLYAVPHHPGAVEYRSPDHATEVQLNRTGARQRIAHRLGMRRRTHSDSLCIAQRGSSEGVFPLLTEIGQTIAPKSAPPLRLRAMAMRGRGALILQCDSDAGALLARVTLDDTVRQRVERNAVCTGWLHQSEAIPLAIRQVVPRPLGQFRLGDVEVFIETRLSGTEIWRLPRSKMEAVRAVREGYRFIETLADATSETLLVDESIFCRLFFVAIEHLPSRLQSVGVDPAALERLLSALRKRVINHDYAVCRGHGDYHLGNLLADPRTGELLAVVDWDTFVEHEISGVDRTHFDILLGMWQTATTLEQSALSLSANATTDERLQIAVALLRIVERSSHFPVSFAEKASSLVNLLSVACEIIDQG
jgi:hypothetical protein